MYLTKGNCSLFTLCPLTSQRIQIGGTPQSRRGSVYIYMALAQPLGKLSLQYSLQIFFFFEWQSLFSVCGGREEGTVCFSVHISLTCLSPNK